jgi:hypothetical protein
VRTCIENDFDSEKIKKYFEKYETDSKYKGLEEYEWKRIKTRKKRQPHMSKGNFLKAQTHNRKFGQHRTEKKA